MNPIDFLSGPVAYALGWTLLHSLWQGFALVLPTAVVLHLLRSRSSDLRYRISVLTLLAQLLVSAATFAWYYEPAARGLVVGNRLAVVSSLPAHWQAVAQTIPWHQQVQQFLQLHLAEFVLIYLIGVVLCGLRLAGGWLYLQRLSRLAAQPATARWTELTDSIRSAMAIRAVVQVRESARIAVPMVVGVLKPVLLLPIGLAANLSLREVEAVLAHELAHIKRHDYAVNLLQSAMEVLYFFHPALWWLSARVREEREHCCDDLAVLTIGGDGRVLAQALAHVEELRLTLSGPTATADQPALAMALVSRRQQLLHRVRRMLGVPTRPFVSNSSLVGLTLATVLLMSVSVYAVQQQEKPKPKSRTTLPQPTRRHKVDTNSEYGMSGNKKVSYVIWKGQKLPAARVARLQRQLDQVMAGQLNLDAVKQPDQDILLTIIEKNSAFDTGMDGLAAGLAHIDYNSIIKTGLDAANAAGTFPVDVDAVLKEVEKVDYNQVIRGAMAEVSQHNGLSSDALDRQLARLQQQMDSLPDQLANNDQAQAKLSKLWADNLALHAQINERQQSFEAYYSRTREPYEQRRRMMEERSDLQRQASFTRKQVDKPEFLPVKKVLLDELSSIDTKLSELDRRIDNLNQNEIRPFRDGQHFKRMRIIMDSIRTNEGQIIDVQERVKINDQDLPQPPRAPRPPKGPNVVRPAIPPVPAVPMVAPAPKPLVVPMPKVAPAPKPE